MENFKLEDIKNIKVGDLPSAKRGIIDSLLGRDIYKEEISIEHMASYKKGHEVGTLVENFLKQDQRDY
ncbi:MAG: hypothetical protein ACERKV_06210 [Clostridiaceae bacterium]